LQYKREDQEAAFADRFMEHSHDVTVGLRSNLSEMKKLREEVVAGNDQTVKLVEEVKGMRNDFKKLTSTMESILEHMVNK
jgi:hypothetical protein